MSMLPYSTGAVDPCPDVARIQRTADRLAWVNDDPANDLESYPGPSWQVDRFEPSLESEIEESGYLRGYQLDWAAQPPSDLDSLRKLVWQIGKLNGVSDR